MAVLVSNNTYPIRYGKLALCNYPVSCSSDFQGTPTMTTPTEVDTMCLSHYLVFPSKSYSLVVTPVILKLNRVKIRITKHVVVRAKHVQNSPTTFKKNVSHNLGFPTKSYSLLVAPAELSI